MEPRKALGDRGLSALFGAKTVEMAQKEKENESKYGKSTLPIDEIHPNPVQPRTPFNEEKLAELANSIRKEGILQPLIVCQIQNGGFELIAGERRLRAAKMAGLKEGPVIFREASQEKRLEWAIIDNIQRHDLDPIEEAKAYQSLMDQFKISQEDVGEYVGKSRGHVSHFLRLLKLPQAVQKNITLGKLSVGHAKVLLNLPFIEEQIIFGQETVNKGFSVRELEEKIRSHKNNSKKSPSKKKIDLSPQLKLLKDEIEKKIGTKFQE